MLDDQMFELVRSRFLFRRACTSPEQVLTKMISSLRVFRSSTLASFSSMSGPHNVREGLTMSTPTPGRPWAAMYGKARWKKLAHYHRSQHPLCVMCLEHGVVTAAEIVDHIVPHHGDPQLFFDPKNLQSMCKNHHDGAKQQIERSGFERTIGTDGWPCDPAHPANRKRRWSED